MNLAQYISTLKDIADPLIRKVFKISPKLNLEYLHDTADDIIYIVVKNIDFDEFAILHESNVKLENLSYKLEHFVAEELAKKELKTEYRFSISLNWFASNPLVKIINLNLFYKKAEKEQ